MSNIIAEYDPNLREGRQHVEVVLKVWAYEARHVVTVGGNCLGFEVMASAVASLFVTLAEGKEIASVTLTNPQGQTMECADDDGREDEWLTEMTVSVRIIGYDPA